MTATVWPTIEAIIAIGGSILTLVATFKLPGDAFREGPAKMLVAQSAMFGDAAVPLFITGLRQRCPPAPVPRASAPCIAIHTRAHNADRDGPAPPTSSSQVDAPPRSNRRRDLSNYDFLWKRLIPLSQVTPFRFFPLPGWLATSTKHQLPRRPSCVAKDLTPPQRPSNRLRDPLWPSPLPAR